MKLILLTLCLLSLSANPQSNSPVSVTLLSPTNGATVSGVIQLSAIASSTAAPIVKVEFYRDGVLIGTVYPPLPPHLTIIAKQ